MHSQRCHRMLGFSWRLTETSACVCECECMCARVCLGGNGKDELLTCTDSLLGNRHCFRQFGAAFKSQRL